MGNCSNTPKQPRTGSIRRDDLSPDERDMFIDNLSIWNTIDEVWGAEGISENEYSGAYQELAGLRQQNNSPATWKTMVDLCSDAWDEHTQSPDEDKLEKGMASLFSFMSMSTLASIFTNMLGDKSKITDIKVSFPKDMTAAERKAGGFLPNMFGDVGKDMKTRAHQLPRNPPCRAFWGKIIEAVVGINLDNVRNDKKAVFMRKNLLAHVEKHRCNKFPFASSHKSYYDTLEDDQCVLLVPLFDKLDDLANWKERQSYEVLVLASSFKTYSALGGFRFGKAHLKWADAEDLAKARRILKSHILALADSLNSHWTSFFEKVNLDHNEFDSKKKEMMDAKARLDKGVMDIPTENLLCPNPLRLFKIDLGVLFHSEAQKPYIPDPMLLALKAACNWSGRTNETRLAKLLCACDPDTSVDDDSSWGTASLLRNIFASAIPTSSKSIASSDIAKHYEKKKMIEFENINDLELVIPRVATDPFSESNSGSYVVDDLSTLSSLSAKIRSTETNMNNQGHTSDLVSDTDSIDV